MSDNNNPVLPRALSALFLLLTFLISGGYAQFTSDILYREDGRLTYVADEEGNYIPDFSHAGYRGGGVPLPEVPVKVTLDPQTGDDTDRIEAALAQVGAMDLDENGIRGAVLLNPGTYQISRNLQILHSGVVLRGSGDDSDPATNTIIEAAKSISGTVIRIGTGNVEWRNNRGGYSAREYNIVDDFVPVGSRVFNVENASGFDVGDNIIVLHRTTEQWLKAVNYGDTDTEPPWRIRWHSDVIYNRYITGISGNTVAIDAPVYNHLDRSLSQSVIYKANRSGLITESGVEDFRLVIETDGELTEEHAMHAMYFDGVENGWARGVTVMHFSYTGIGTTSSSFITIKDCRTLEPHSLLQGSRRYSFNAFEHSNNILVENAYSTESRHDFISNGMASVSGLVFTNSRGVNSRGPTEGHRLWSQGILFDKLTFENTITGFVILGHYNRGSGGSGHGWASAHSVAWNIESEPIARIFIEKPPTAQNYGIGMRGDVRDTGPYGHPKGYIEGTGQVPEFASLYQTQLEERLTYGVPPSPPSRMIVIEDDEKQTMELSWSHASISENDYEFILERSEDGGNTFTEIAVLDSDITSYLDEDVADVYYHYRVRASDETGKSAWSNIAKKGDLFDIVPAKTEIVYPTFNITVSTSPVFEWKEVNFAREYQIQITASNFANILLDTLVTGSSFEYPGELEAGQSHRWRVRALNNHQGPWSDETLFNTEQATSAEDEPGIPSHFLLEHNYPNPFNPATTIKYGLPTRAYVTLRVYDVIGREVATLVNREQQAGYHNVVFDSGGISSGVFYYRLEAVPAGGSDLDRFVQTQSMTLVK